MAGALKYFSIDCTNNPKEKDPCYYIYKIVLACQDALLLSIKKYHYSYKIRNEIFRESFSKYFNNLDEGLPDFLSLTLKATNYKLEQDRDDDSKNVTELWFDVVEICDKVFRYVIEKDMNITFNSYLEFQEKYLRHPNIRQKYYRGLISFPMYQNLWSIADMWTKIKSLPRLTLITKIWIPWVHIIYSSIPLIYFSLSRNGEINEVMLKQVRNNLSLFKNLKSTNQNLFKEWEYLKEQLISIWDVIC